MEKKHELPARPPLPRATIFFFQLRFPQLRATESAIRPVFARSPPSVGALLTRFRPRGGPPSRDKENRPPPPLVLRPSQPFASTLFPLPPPIVASVPPVPFSSRKAREKTQPCLQITVVRSTTRLSKNKNNKPNLRPPSFSSVLFQCPQTTLVALYFFFFCARRSSPDAACPPVARGRERKI